MNYTHRYAMELNEKISAHEKQYNITLEKNKLYVLRFDGVKMTKNFLSKAEYRVPFFKTMKETISSFMINNPGFKFAYSFSDEISIVLTEEILEEHDYRLQKILSIFSSQMGFIFGFNAHKFRLELNDKIRCFDCRLIEFENIEDLKDYFISRQVFQISSHFIRLKHRYLPDLKANNTNIIINELRKVNVYYDKLTKAERYGVLWVEDCFQIPYEFLANEEKLLGQLELDSKYTYIKKLEKRPKSV